jgi:hypothetical protein
MTPDPKQDPHPEAQALAAELAARLGREQGDALLAKARTLLVLGAAARGPSTSEFKLAALAIVSGLALVGLGVATEQPDLLDRGLELVQWATVGYGVSRGLAKAGVAKQQSTPPVA